MYNAEYTLNMLYIHMYNAETCTHIHTHPQEGKVKVTDMLTVKFSLPLDIAPLNYLNITKQILGNVI